MPVRLEWLSKICSLSRLPSLKKGRQALETIHADQMKGLVITTLSQISGGPVEYSVSVTLPFARTPLTEQKKKRVSTMKGVDVKEREALL
jgi:hypothetical protein